MSTDKGIWVFVDRRKEEIENVSLEVQGKGRQLANELGEKVKVSLTELFGKDASFGSKNIRPVR